MQPDSQFTERRGHPRATYMTLLRPQLRLPFGTHPVLDASQTGIRVHHSVPVRPKLGSVLQGTLEFAHGEPPLQVSGTSPGQKRVLDFGAGHPPGYLPMTALQDQYPEDFSHCYGCGRLNSHGLHVKSEWKDGEAVARFTPGAVPYRDAGLRLWRAHRFAD